MRGKKRIFEEDVLVGEVVVVVGQCWAVFSNLAKIFAVNLFLLILLCTPAF